MATHRVQRGRESQVFAANYLKNIFPDAASIAASLPGKDILNTPGWSFEVKGRRDFKPTEWSKQASKYGDTDRHACIMRPDGYGEAKVGQWLVFMTFEEFRDLLGKMDCMEREIQARKHELVKVMEKHAQESDDDGRADFYGSLDDAYWL